MFAAVWALIERGSGLEAGGARGPQAFAPATRELLEKVLAYNFCRMAACRRADAQSDRIAA